MLTRGGCRDSLAGKSEDSLVAHTFDRNRWLSLQPRDAPIGTVVLALIVAGVLMIRITESFGRQRTPTGRMLSVVILFFAPAILGGVYSLFFEKSKVYGILDLVLAGIALWLLPFTWVWLNTYLPFACILAAFCALVRVLEHGHKQ